MNLSTVDVLDAYAWVLRVLVPLFAIELVFLRRHAYALAQEPPHARGVARDVAIDFVQLVAAWIALCLIGWVGVLALRQLGVSASEFARAIPGLLVRGGLVLSVAVVAASVTTRRAYAILLTVAFTLSIWAFDFVARADDTIAALAAAYGVEATLRDMELGGIRPNILSIIIVTIASHLALAVAWLQPNLGRDTRWAATLAILVASTVLTGLAGMAPTAFLYALPLLIFGAAWWMRSPTVSDP